MLGGPVGSAQKQFNKETRISSGGQNMVGSNANRNSVAAQASTTNMVEGNGAQQRRSGGAQVSHTNGKAVS